MRKMLNFFLTEKQLRNEKMRKRRWNFNKENGKSKYQAIKNSNSLDAVEKRGVL